MRFQEVDSASNCHSERSETSIVWNSLTRLSAAGRNFTNTLYGQIDAFYKEAGFQHGWNGSVNENVAYVFGKMLAASRDCSSALNWVPRPTGRVTIKWIVKHLGRSFFERSRANDTSFALSVLYITLNLNLKWRPWGYD
mgnify:CR=1 FL=1